MAASHEFEGSEKPVAETTKPKINEVAQRFIADLDEERQRLSAEFPLCALLIDDAIERVYSTGRIIGKEIYADVYKQKPMKITQKVFLPIKQYPKFNFTGKILGPKGNSLKRLQDETQCKVVIKGRGSMRDRTKEEEMRNTGDPKFSHLDKDLFLEISSVAPPAECYARIAYALAEIRKFIIPDKNDEVSHEQLRELLEINPELAKQSYTNNPEIYKSVLDKTGMKGTHKYLSLLKRSSYQDAGAEVAGYEENQITPKRAVDSSEFSYFREPSTTAKRHSAMTYLAEAKRIREIPTKPYGAKPHPYVVMKKFK